VVQAPEVNENIGATRGLSVVLQASTGLIQGKAWGQLADRLRILANAASNAESDVVVLLSSEGFKVRLVESSSPRCHSLSLSGRTVMELVNEATRVTTKVNMFPFHSHLYNSAMQDLERMEAPFTSSVRGVVHSIVSTSNAASWGRGVRLQASRFCRVHSQMVALGRHAETGTLTYAYARP